MELDAPILSLVTFDLYLSHRVTVLRKQAVSSISRTMHVIKMKLAIRIKYIKHMSHIPVLFG